ncbi:hypothetical protein BCR39DRAFT_555213 [Naematelia encephala]|uniref:Uncharacterized protein n=1 Tax=Naematelia encephala TaxID=71784 RepID=A0A1Y2ADE7_9TREE|nr:hypothetical protein BCR39DRAFT_555213 [Naematelia encephala]
MSDSDSGPSSAPHTKAIKKRGHAGGVGKKGKVFLEDKAGLLSLVESVTSSQDTARESKLEKTRVVTAKYEDQDKDKERVKGDLGKKKRIEKEKALSKAKAEIIQQSRDKKRRRKATSVRSPLDAIPRKTGLGDHEVSIKRKKRVGFA